MKRKRKKKKKKEKEKKKKKKRESVLYGGTEIEREQVGVELEIILFGYLFGRRVGTISASISELIWTRGSAIISSFNGFIQAPISVIFTAFNGVIGIVIVAHISAYLTTVEGGIGGGFSEGVAVYVAAFFSNVIGLYQALINGASATCNNNFIGIDSEAPVSAYICVQYNSGFMTNFSQTLTIDPSPYRGVILPLVILKYIGRCIKLL